MKTVLANLMIFASIASLAAGEIKPILHAAFDQDFRAEAGNAVIEGKHPMKITMETLSMLLQKGIRGKAAKIGIQQVNGVPEGSLVHYPGKYLKPDAGTVAFWLKPLNWDFKDERFHIFFEACGPDSWLVVYKYCDAHALYFLFGRKGGRRGTDWVIAEAPAAKWERGVFRHVTVSWSQENIRLYLDGMLQKTVKIVSSGRPRHFEYFSVGPRSAAAWKNQIGESLIDDLRIYDFPLASGQVESLYQSYGAGNLDKSRIPVKVSAPRMMISPDGKVLNLTFMMTRTTRKNTGFPVEMEVVLNGKKQILKKILNSASAEYQYAFPLAELTDGDYLVLLRPIRETPQDVTENNSFRFTVGEAAPVMDHSVPDPWDPVVLKKQDGRQILTAKMQKTVFGKNVFPVQLYSQNIPLLRDVVAFICNGQLFRSFSGRKVVEAHPDLQVVESRGEDDRFELKSRCRFEFDGMMWFEVTLTPKGRQTVKQAKIEIPLRREVSTLYNCFAKDYFHFRGYRAGALTRSVKRNHYQCSGSELPVIWIGNEERGLYYFTRDQSGRRLKNRDETIRLDPGKEGAVLTVNLIDYDSVLDKPVTWKFGLQVTPMRPFVRNRTLWRPEKNIGLWFPWEKIHNVPDARFKIDNYEKKRRSWSRRGAVPLFHYFAGFSVSPENPGYPQHAYDWSLTPPAVGTEFSPNSRTWCYISVCPESASYRNTYIRSMEKCIRELKMQYLYFDNCWSWMCANKRHGCGWYDEHGQFYPGANILGGRELAKENYRILRKQYPFGLIARHISQIPEPPLAAFADCLVDGECFMMDVGRDENYYNVFKPDFFRASFMGVQFGLPSIYIAQFNRAYSEHFPEKLPAAKAGKLKNQAKHLRHFMGYILAHDADVWPNFGVNAASVWNIMDKAGVGGNTPFYGYWRKDNPIRKVAPKSERVMVSSYQIPDGYLTAVMNDTDKEAAVELSSGDSGMDSCWNLTDAESGKRIDGKTILVPARDYKLVKIRK